MSGSYADFIYSRNLYQAYVNNPSLYFQDQRVRYGVESGNKAAANKRINDSALYDEYFAPDRIENIIGAEAFFAEADLYRGQSNGTDPGYLYGTMILGAFLLGDDDGRSGSSGKGYGAIIQGLPDGPSKLGAEWVEVTHPSQAANSSSREFLHTKSNLRVRFDEGKVGTPGWEGTDHWHVYNPAETGKRNLYLNAQGQPVAKGSPASHIPAK